MSTDTDEEETVPELEINLHRTGARRTMSDMFQTGNSEPIRTESRVRQSMQEMFGTEGPELAGYMNRRPSGEKLEGDLALSTSVLKSIEQRVGGDLSDYVMNITVRNALRTRGEEAERVLLKELRQMIDKKVWKPVKVGALSPSDRGRIIRSQMFLKEKYLPYGAFEKLKARLVAGGDQQDKELYDNYRHRRCRPVRC